MLCILNIIQNYILRNDLFVPFDFNIFYNNVIFHILKTFFYLLIKFNFVLIRLFDNSCKINYKSVYNITWYNYCSQFVYDKPAIAVM